MSKEMEHKKNKIETDTGEGRPGPSSDTPFVSVMVLNYRYGEVLRRALEACAEQTFRDFEIVMINNGAIDNTQEIWGEFCEKHPEIRKTYVHVEKNQGPRHGWNAGLEHACGEYVMFNDADDWMDPDCLEKLAKIARETGTDRVSGQFRYVLPDGRVTKEEHYAKGLYIATAGIQCTLFRRSVIEENDLHFPEEINMFSYDTWMIYHFAAAEKNKGEILDQTVYNYQVNPLSLTTGFNQEGAGQRFLDTVSIPFMNYTSELLKRIPKG